MSKDAEKPVQNTNMSIWDSVKTTDPKHTKPFQRAGGFSGTAIKPIYSIETMTKQFGPVGFGWGYSKPEYVTHNASENQILVYCTVGVWYSRDGQKSDLFYGVGGDFVIVKQKAGLRSDDEAYKKSFTDAMGNAFKHLGLSADVHMNQFDGNKYADDKKDDPKPEKPKPPEHVIKFAEGYKKLQGVTNKDDFAAIWFDYNPWFEKYRQDNPVNQKFYDEKVIPLFNKMTGEENVVSQ